MVSTKLNDGLDDDFFLDEHGYPAEMDPEERAAIEEAEYEERLQRAVSDTLAFLELGGSL